MAHISAGVAWQAGVKRSRETMADTRLPHWTICAALALVATGVAAEPMGEATRHVSTVGGRERTFIEYVPKTLKPGAPLLIEESPISLGLIQSIRENSVSVTPLSTRS
jgi:hypothetical protein